VNQRCRFAFGLARFSTKKLPFEQLFCFEV